MSAVKQLKKAAALIEKTCGRADVAVILGSGLGGFEDTLQAPRAIAYEDIPDFPVSTVPGHEGKFVVGELGGQRVLVMSGRFHSYEGYGMEEVTMPVRVMSLLGVRTLIVTNAAGGVNMDFSAGDLMLITDFINLSGRNPLRGPNLDEFGPRFPDMSNAYAPALRSLALAQAQQLGIPLRQGVYCWMNGPCFETPAEIRMVRILGADAVGMSTVPETIIARHCGMQVLGISSITNMAAGVLDEAINHEEVLLMGQRIRGAFGQLVQNIIANLPLPASEEL